MKMTEDTRLLADGPIMNENAMRKEANVRLRETTSAPQIDSHTNCQRKNIKNKTKQR